MNLPNMPVAAACGLALALLASCSDSSAPTASSSDGTSSIRADLIPDSLQRKLKEHVTIYEGNYPADISGCFLQSPATLSYSNRAKDSSRIGSRYTDLLLCFERKAGSSLYSYKGTEYRNDTAIGSESSDSVYLIGSGRNFTAYFVGSGTYGGTSWYREANVIAGVLKDSGVANLTNTFLMIDRGDTSLVEAGTIRSFDDSDRFSPRKSAATASARSLRPAEIPFPALRKD